MKRKLKPLKTLKKGELRVLRKHKSMKATLNDSGDGS